MGKSSTPRSVVAKGCTSTRNILYLDAAPCCLGSSRHKALKCITASSTILLAAVSTFPHRETLLSPANLVEVMGASSWIKMLTIWQKSVGSMNESFWFLLCECKRFSVHELWRARYATDQTHLMEFGYNFRVTATKHIDTGRAKTSNHQSKLIIVVFTANKMKMIKDLLLKHIETSQKTLSTSVSPILDLHLYAIETLWMPQRVQTR